jgi:hypothetical protein
VTVAVFLAQQIWLSVVLTLACQLYINLANNSRLDSYFFTPFAVVTSGMWRAMCIANLQIVTCHACARGPSISLRHKRSRNGRS